MAELSSVPRTGFEDVVTPHLDYLYAVAVRLCGDRTAAEDLVQEALLRAFRGFGGLRNRDRPRPWLTRISPESTSTA
ncbi:MAG: RNA polymerase sigma factor [Armatimonadota bacterium]|nr:RNA polymerase sigma factor [Armatimonadota bacterium]MDR7532030.1 RNA polymerase sigma factor [Armatimonadota bacterium]MDR7535961.1 RNA polymerase sigma factor [Armatimonadota bacterium]